MTAHHGRYGMVYLNTGTGSASPLTKSTSWSLDRATDKVEVTAFGEANKTYVQGLPDLKGSLNGYWDDADDTLFTAADSTTAVTMYLYPTTTNTAKRAYGTAWVDASIECGVDGAVKVTGQFVAAGSWVIEL